MVKLGVSKNCKIFVYAFEKENGVAVAWLPAVHARSSANLMIHAIIIDLVDSWLHWKCDGFELRAATELNRFQVFEKHFCKLILNNAFSKLCLCFLTMPFRTWIFFTRFNNGIFLGEITIDNWSMTTRQISWCFLKA